MRRYEDKVRVIRRRSLQQRSLLDNEPHETGTNVQPSCCSSVPIHLRNRRDPTPSTASPRPLWADVFCSRGASRREGDSAGRRRCSGGLGQLWTDGRRLERSDIVDRIEALEGGEDLGDDGGGMRGDELGTGKEVIRGGRRGMPCRREPPNELASAAFPKSPSRASVRSAGTTTDPLLFRARSFGRREAALAGVRGPRARSVQHAQARRVGGLSPRQYRYAASTGEGTYRLGRRRCEMHVNKSERAKERARIPTT